MGVVKQEEVWPFELASVQASARKLLECVINESTHKQPDLREISKHDAYVAARYLKILLDKEEGAADGE